MISMFGDQERDYEPSKCLNQYNAILEDFRTHIKTENERETIYNKLKHERISELIKNINNQQAEIHLLDTSAKKIEKWGITKFCSIKNIDHENLVESLIEGLKPKMEQLDEKTKPLDLQKRQILEIEPETSDQVIRKLKIPFICEIVNNIPEGLDNLVDFCYPTHKLFETDLSSPKLSMAQKRRKPASSVSNIPNKLTKVIPESPLLEHDEYDYLKSNEILDLENFESQIMESQIYESVPVVQTEEFSREVTTTPTSQSSHSLSSHASTLKYERQWRKSIVILLEHISSYKCSFTFLSPVPEKIKRYYQLVKRARDLKTMTKEIESGVIRDFITLNRDLYLMFANSLMYNPSDSNLYIMTFNMFEDAITKIADYKASIDEN
ncbi:Bromodomain-containing protein 8 [Thelohanellus kitauei]|uniref:Bromodomain-containing protein 8 n=1 Tax=Thelohanellus kitauei TaxID=669202 RepID=A0A0C2J2P0_THEKT|nr:Bromodomain-containing protein 8 [Thelohanellus kitauei]